MDKEFGKPPEDEAFRDTIATVDAEGKRKWVFPKQPKGRYYRARAYVNFFLLAFLFAAPHIRVGGEPLLLFNFMERKFVVFGKVFWPQDLYIFLFAALTFVVFIALFTVVYGRLFCGWVCPQTIFLEGVFRKIEYWIDGDWKQQMKLTKQDWNHEKIIKRLSKHSIFFAISFLIANTFLAYIIGSEALFQIITEPPAEHWVGLTSILIFSGVFYGVFAFFREQVCTTVCPYGRMQSVLLDRQSVVVAYDYGRGEPRAKVRKNEVRAEVGKGDCIDCGHCVNVCPTGIDIRHGTQLECVNCTACIDACDAIMDAVELPRGLIRYASEEQIATRKPFAWSSRAKGYSLVLVLLFGIMVALLVSRSDIQVNFFKTPGMVFIKNDDGSISNLYNFKIINKSNADMKLDFLPLDTLMKVRIIGRPPHPGRHEVAEGSFFISAPAGAFALGKTITELGIVNEQGEVLDKVEVRITGPL